MTITWDQIPLEMRHAVVSKMGIKSRVNLSMCSKLENQLVRSTKHGNVEYIGLEGNKFIIEFNGYKIDEQRVTVEPSSNGGSNVLVRHTKFINEEYSTKTDWKETIWNIMRLIGTTLKVDVLELRPDIGFEESFNWLRNNIHIKPQLVRFNIYTRHMDYYDESIFDWPSNTKFELHVFPDNFSNLERFIAYDNIVTFGCYGRDSEYAGVMTDEKLTKLKNAKNVSLYYSDVTINGFEWWLKKWLAQKNDSDEYKFDMMLNDEHEFSFENITNKLSDVIGKTEQCFCNISPVSYWKIEIRKNGKAGGCITLSNDSIYFHSNEDRLPI